MRLRWHTRFDEGRWWRRWNPWWLRSELRVLAQWLADERGWQTTDSRNTAAEREWRLATGILLGYGDPARYALNFSVKGSTLCIDATKDEP